MSEAVCAYGSGKGKCTRATTGGKFCSLHTCTSPGCQDPKSSSDAACVHHRTTKELPSKPPPHVPTPRAAPRPKESSSDPPRKDGPPPLPPKRPGFGLPEVESEPKANSFSGAAKGKADVEAALIASVEDLSKGGGVPNEQTTIILLGAGNTGKTTTLASARRQPFQQERVSTRGGQVMQLQFQDHGQLRSFEQVSDDDMGKSTQRAVLLAAKERIAGRGGISSARAGKDSLVDDFVESSRNFDSSEMASANREEREQRFRVQVRDGVNLSVQIMLAPGCWGM
jgi:hypothetical protein